MEIGWVEYGSEVTEIQGKALSEVASLTFVLGAVARGRRFLESLRQGPGDRHWWFRGPAGQRSRGARGRVVTEQREPRIRCRSGQGLREGTGRAVPAGPFGTRAGRGDWAGVDPLRTLPGHARGWEVWQGRGWQSPGAGLERDPTFPAGAGALHGGGQGAQTGGAVPPAGAC